MRKICYLYFTAKEIILHKIKLFYCEKFLFLKAVPRYLPAEFISFLLISNFGAVQGVTQTLTIFFRSIPIFFAKYFNVIQTDFQEREAEWRIFGKVNRVITQYPEETIWQKRAKNYLLPGKVLGSSWGVLEKQ